MWSVRDKQPYGPNSLTDPTAPFVTIDSIGNYSLEVTNADNGCSSMLSIDIDNIDCTSSSYHSITADKYYTIYPNPFDGFIQIDNGYKSNIDFCVINSLVQLILKYSGTNNRLSTSNWPAGQYYLELISIDQISWKVIQKSK